MSRYVIDTHALHWHLARDSRLSTTAKQVLADADGGLHQVLVPSIVLIEVIYLVEKGRLEARLAERLFALLQTARGSYTVATLDLETARAMEAVPRTAVPDMPDRIIVATAHQRQLPLITRDAKIHSASIVPVIW